MPTFLSGMTALVLICADGVMLLYLAVFGEWRHRPALGDILALVMIAAIMLMSLPGVLAPLTMWRRHRVALAAQHHDFTRAPESDYQLQTTQALTWGASLEIRRTLLASQYVALLLIVPVSIVMFGTLSSVALLHVLAPQTLTLFPSAPVLVVSHITARLWAVLAMPIVILCVAYGRAIHNTHRQRDVHIYADDQGITWHGATRQPLQLRWDEIHYCLFWPARARFGRHLLFDGAYQCGNAETHISFTTAFWPAIRASEHHASPYQYHGGGQIYFQDMIRLLSTMAARSAITIQVPAHLFRRTVGGADQFQQNMMVRQTRDHDAAPEATLSPPLSD